MLRQVEANGFISTLELKGTHWVTPDGGKYRLVEDAVQHIREAFRGMLPRSPPVVVERLKCRYSIVWTDTGTVHRWYETFAGAMRYVVKARGFDPPRTGVIVPRVEHVNMAQYPRRVGKARRGHRRSNAYHRRMAKYRRQGVVDLTKGARKDTLPLDVGVPSQVDLDAS